MTGDLTERQAFLVLNALPGVGSVGRNQILEAVQGDPRPALSGNRAALMGLPGGAASAIRDWRGHFDVRKEESRMEQSGTVFLTPADAGYPPLLREISDPPIGLYRRGPFLFDAPCIAVVGSRRATVYGQSVARHLGMELARLGFCVVSGLARGIDTAAHEGALAAGGLTAAVLGTGIDVIYPPENLGLYRAISVKGAVLSEFPFGRAADPDSFPMRSRVVSGICEATVVVESDPHGGAMTTARFAGEQGRLLFAVPGRIDQSTSAGCHQLIRDGATLLSRIDDLLQELQFLGGLRPVPPAARPSPQAPSTPSP